MKTSTRHLYQQARRAGYDAKFALRIAKTAEKFRARSDVRIIAEPELESYFDVYGEPDGYTDTHGRYVTPEQERQSICETLDRDGCWLVVAEWFNHETEEWEQADSVGMCVYSDPCDPIENCYVAQLMQSALDAAEANDESYVI